MVDYDFYINTYLGSAIDEKNFPAAAARAAAVLEGYERRCRVHCPGPDSKRLAICAMAEVIFQYGIGRLVESANIGNVSVRYDSRGGQSLERALMQKASIYLDVLRGVGSGA